MVFIVGNQKDFLKNAYVHSSNIRNKNNLYLPVSYSGVKIFNSLPSDIHSNKNDRKRFENKSYRY
jgi:hypothetical protein